MNARYPIRAGRRLGLSSTPGGAGLEGASQTFLKGAPLIFTGGYLVEAGANPTGLVGIADEDAHNVAAGASTIHYTPCISGILFEASIDKASGLGAYESVITNLGTEYGITKDANGIWYIDIDKTGANGRFRVLEFPEGNMGALFTRVYGVFTQDVTIYGIS